MSDDQVKQTIDTYAADVCSGEIIASSWVVRAAGRYLDDLEHQAERGLIFDEAAAAHVVKFFEFLEHSKGEWGGQRFELQPWQQFILANVYGCVVQELDGFVHHARELWRAESVLAWVKRCLWHMLRCLEGVTGTYSNSVPVLSRTRTAIVREGQAAYKECGEVLRRDERRTGIVPLCLWSLT